MNSEGGEARLAELVSDERGKRRDTIVWPKGWRGLGFAEREKTGRGKIEVFAERMQGDTRERFEI